MTRRPSLTLIGDADDLPDYPLPKGLRLAGHYYLGFEFNAYLNSRFRLRADAMSRAVALDLWCHAQNQDPIGTLPDDDEQLAKLTGMSVERWRELRGAEFGPLFKWERCRASDGEIRLMHPKVLGKIEEAMDSRARREMRRGERAAEKRLSDLADRVVKAGGSRGMASDQDLLRRLAAWLDRHCEGRYWTVEWVRRAMEVDATKDVGVMR
ncbi:MAG: hypothetical protein MUE98_00255 [Rhodobacteraceae bacterium]|jgi:hypothetical protein|nr:hypothetical protein [Paracoccaceae bacterium]